MRLLLDTHSFLWFITGNEQLSDPARRLITDLDNQAFVSIVSLWEIAIKTSLGKLTLVRPFEELIPEQLTLNSIEVLPIGVPHLSVLITLPWHHRDPFDRLNIAQALAEDMPVISRDPSFPSYSLHVLWEQSP